MQQPSAVAIAAFNEGLARFWQPVALAASIGEAPVATELLERPLCLIRLEGEVRAFDDVCRHLGASLSIGEVVSVDGAPALRCRYHGWTYDATGRVVDIPARRDLPIPREAKVGSYHCREAYGLVWVCLAEAPAAGLPAYPEHDDPRFRPTAYRVYEPWTASATRIVMGALDDTHFAWVHPGTLGDPEHPEPPDHEASVRGDHMLAEYTIRQPANVSLGSAPDAAGLEEVRYANHAHPTTIRLLKQAPGGNFVLFQTMQPLAYNRTRIYLQVARDFDLDPARDEAYLQFEDVVQSQDRPVVESQRPWLLPPLNARLTLYIRPADLPLVVYQRWMEELGIPQL